MSSQNGSEPGSLTMTRRVHISAEVCLAIAANEAPEINFDATEGDEPMALTFTIGGGNVRDVFIFAPSDLAAIEQALARFRIRRGIALPE